MGAREVIGTHIRCQAGGIIYHDETDKLIEALTAAGYAIVPVEPTEAMMEAAALKVYGKHWPSKAYADVYRAMIEAAK